MPTVAFFPVYFPNSIALYALSLSVLLNWLVGFCFRRCVGCVVIDAASVTTVFIPVVDIVILYPLRLSAISCSGFQLPFISHTSSVVYIYQTYLLISCRRCMCLVGSAIDGHIAASSQL